MVRFRLDQNNKISKSPSISVYIGKYGYEGKTIIKYLCGALLVFRDGFLRHCRHFLRLCPRGFWVESDNGGVTPLYGLCIVLVPRSPHRYKDE